MRKNATGFGGEPKNLGANGLGTYKQQSQNHVKVGDLLGGPPPTGMARFDSDVSPQLP
jgi:predicted Ser/Thr protein kinase